MGFRHRLRLAAALVAIATVIQPVDSAPRKIRGVPSGARVTVGPSTIRGLKRRPELQLSGSASPEPEGILAEVEKENRQDALREERIRGTVRRGGALGPATGGNASTGVRPSEADAAAGVQVASGIRKLRRREILEGRTALSAPEHTPAEKGEDTTIALLRRENEVLRSRLMAGAPGTYGSKSGRFPGGTPAAPAPSGSRLDAAILDESDTQGSSTAGEGNIPVGAAPVGLRALLLHPSTLPSSPPSPIACIPGVAGSMEAGMAFAAGFDAVLLGAAAARARLGADADLSIGDARALLADLGASGRCPPGALLVEGAGASAGPEAAGAAARGLAAAGVGGLVLADGPGGLCAGARVLTGEEFLRNVDAAVAALRTGGGAGGGEGEGVRDDPGSGLLLFARTMLPRVGGPPAARARARKEARLRLRAALEHGAHGVVIDWWPAGGAGAAGSLAAVEEVCPLRTDRTRRVLHPVLIGHAASFTP